MSLPKDSHEVIRLAVARADGAKKLGQACVPPVSRQAVQLWIKAGVIPAKHVPTVSKVTGIDRSALNPLFK